LKASSIWTYLELASSPGQFRDFTLIDSESKRSIPAVREWLSVTVGQRREFFKMLYNCGIMNMPYFGNSSTGTDARLVFRRPSLSGNQF
jgi:hypothetical protein